VRVRDIRGTVIREKIKGKGKPYAAEK